MGENKVVGLGLNNLEKFLLLLPPHPHLLDDSGNLYGPTNCDNSIPTRYLQSTTLGFHQWLSRGSEISG